MGYIALGVLVLTLVALLFGALFGLMRGLNRSLLRLGLIVLCVVLAILLRGVVVNAVLGIEVEGKTLSETLLSALTSEATLPQSVIDLVFALIEIVIGIVAYFALFFVLRFITWVLFYPILKIWVKKGEKKRGWWGALVGLGQGLIIAFVMWAPVTGLLVQANKVIHLEVDGKAIVAELPEEIGVAEYPKSVPGAVYDATGNWYFEILGSTKDAEGRTVRLSDVCDIAVTVVDIANNVTELGADLENFTGAETQQDMVTFAKAVGNKLIDMGNSLDSLSPSAKALINDLIDSLGELIDDEGEGSFEIPEGFTLDSVDIAALGESLVGIATYVEKTSPEFGINEPVTQDEVNSLVGAFADSLILFDAFMEGGEYVEMCPVIDEHKSMFESAISAQGLSAEDEANLRILFGL